MVALVLPLPYTANVSHRRVSVKDELIFSHPGRLARSIRHGSSCRATRLGAILLGITGRVWEHAKTRSVGRDGVMSAARSSRSSGASVHPTRQQLDELDALLQRMLEL